MLCACTAGNLIMNDAEFPLFCLARGYKGADAVTSIHSWFSSPGRHGDAAMNVKLIPTSATPEFPPFSYDASGSPLY